MSGAKAEAPANGAAPTTDTITHASLAEALLAAQIDMPAVDRDQTNPHFKSKFASLGNLLSKARPVLNRHGIVLVQAPTLDEEGRFVLRTIFKHSSGEALDFDAPLSPTKNDPQGQGSAITYMRRYVLAAALAIADQEDDDGNAGSERQQARGAQAKRRDGQSDGRSAQMTAAQRRTINGRAGDLGLTEPQLLAWVEWHTGERHPDRVTKARASELIEKLEGYADAEEALAEFNAALESEDERAQKIAAKQQDKGNGS